MPELEDKIWSEIESLGTLLETDGASESTTPRPTPSLPICHLFRLNKKIAWDNFLVHSVFQFTNMGRLAIF